MARYSANNPNRVLVLHKDECNEVSKAELSGCGCRPAIGLGNTQWFCEQHITRDAVDDFMGGRFWAILLCTKCFSIR